MLRPFIVALVLAMILPPIGIPLLVGLVIIYAGRHFQRDGGPSERRRAAVYIAGVQ